MGIYVRKTVLTALCGTLLLLGLAGCSKNDESAPSEISVSGSEGVSLDAPFPVTACGVRLENAPERIVSLSPAATEIICELGFRERLVGISDYCDYPEGLSAERVGSTENPNIDEIAELKPDAVFTLSALSERDIYTLNQANIAVLTAEPPKNMEGYSALYREIAAAFYGKETVDSEKDTRISVQTGADARSTLEKAAKNVQLGSFVYVTGKLTAAGAETFESSVLGLAGENVCTENGYVPLDNIERTPKYIIADSSLTEDDLASDETLSGFIYDGAEIRFVDASLFERPSARTAMIFEQLAADEL